MMTVEVYWVQNEPLRSQERTSTRFDAEGPNEAGDSVISMNIVELYSDFSEANFRVKMDGSKQNG